MKKRTIAVLIGSDSDLKQCEQGLKLLQEAEANGEIKCVGVYTGSIHRNTERVLLMLTREFQLAEVDILITGAGMANHLSGMCDSYLRYQLNNVSTSVIGVAFSDAKNSINTQAAKLSVSQVPGTQVVFQDAAGQFVGADGFARACALAVTGPLPDITEPLPKKTSERTIEQALEFIQAQKAEVPHG